LGGPERTGALTLISAISPPGGDFSEPVTQASLRVAGALWALDPALAHQRQFPAVDWETSYSLYGDVTDPWFAAQAGPEWPQVRRDTMELMQKERELREIAGLVGPEALQDRDRLLLDVAALVRETVLGQSAFDPNDALSPVAKTHRLAVLAHELYRQGLAAIDAGTAYETLDLSGVRRALAGLRRTAPAEMETAAAAATQTIAALGPALVEAP
jgi:V/A-type H+-transporting ATPase subunit A